MQLREGVFHPGPAVMSSALKPTHSAACGLQVTSTRKGLRNQFKALLGLRKPGALSPETARPVAANGTYDNSSPEGQLRQLGDLAFMLQDYETAASSYQLLAADLKADRAWRQFAATQVRRRCPPVS